MPRGGRRTGTTDERSKHRYKGPMPHCACGWLPSRRSKSRDKRELEEHIGIARRDEALLATRPDWMEPVAEVHDGHRVEF
jgi:hypothetical protein